MDGCVDEWVAQLGGGQTTPPPACETTDHVVRDPAPYASPDTAYRTHSRLLVASSLSRASFPVCIAVSLYAVGELLTQREWTLVLLGPYAVQFAAIAVAVWAVRGPLRDHPEAVALAADLTFAGCITGQLVFPVATTSGTALVLAVKMLVTALLFPWGARFQYASAAGSILMYCSFLAWGGRLGGADGSVHLVAGPLIAALLSRTGAATAEQRRRALFERTLELEDSRAHLQALLDAVPDGMLVLQGDRAIFANPRLARMLAVPDAAMLLGRRVHEFVGAAHSQQVETYLSHAADAPAPLDTAFRRIDGTDLPVALSVAPLRYQGLSGVQVLVRDVTDRTVAAAALAEAAHISATLARVAHDLITSFDSTRFLENLCRMTAEALGCDISYTLLRQPDEDVFAPIAGYGGTTEEWEMAQVVRIPRAMMAGLLERLRDVEVACVGTTPATLDLPAEHLDTARLCMALRYGREIIGVQVAHRRGPNELFTRAQLRIAEGIAQLGSLALEHARLVRELEHTNRLKSEFVATMSHELRTPLNIIIGYTGLLREGAFGPLTPDQAETQERVDTKARELLDLIAATLDLSRLDTGRVKVDRGDIDLVALFREIDAETCEARHKPGVAYVCRLAPGLPALISDAQKLKIVVKNLVLNAAKFTDQGEIAVVVQPRNGGVEISVADTGIGIAPQILPHIFEPFRQADSSPTRRHDGVGLGLYIVRRFLDVLGGEIDVASQPGRGSTFRIWLPWQPAPSNAAQGPLPRSGR